jgi:hypothetical protein
MWQQAHLLRIAYLSNKDSTVARAVGGDFKGKVSMVLYIVAIVFSFLNSWLACVLYVLVAIMSPILGRRIEKTLIP